MGRCLRILIKVLLEHPVSHHNVIERGWLGHTYQLTLGVNKLKGTDGPVGKLIKSPARDLLHCVT